ncbi:MAG: PAS domain S-box protein, partial [Gemmataceae bacterium]
LLGMAYGLEGIAVATTVPGPERYDWEKKQSAGQSSPMRILEYDPQGNLRQAPARDHYLSVLFHSPSASGMVAPGQNLTQPEFGLIGEKHLPFLENGLLLRVPRPVTTLLLRPRMVVLAQSFQTAAGETLVVVGMFREDQLLAPLGSFGHSSARFQLEEAVTDPAESLIQDRDRAAAWWQTLPLNPNHGSLRFVSHANESYMAQHRNPNRSFWGLLAVVGTIPLVMLLLVLTGQTAMVEALVEQRSDELRQEMSVRALTENVLRTSQSQLIEAQRFARLGGWECDPYTEALYWSDEANIVFDLKTDGQELKLADLWLRLHPDHITNFRQSFIEATLSETYRATFEVQAWHRDGRLGYFMLAFRTVNEEGVPIIQGTIQEITEQKQIQQLKEFSEEQFRQVFESAAIGKAVVDLEGKILTANASLCEFLGITREELQTKSMRDVTHPDDHDADDFSMKRLLSGSISNVHMERRYLRNDGRVVWGLLTVSVIRDAHGQPVHFISQVFDIGARRDAEVALRISEARLAEAQRIAQVGYWEWDPDAEMVWWSDLTYQLLGYEPQSVPASYESLMNAVHPDDRAMIAEQMKATAEGYAPYNFDFRILLADGQSRVIHTDAEIDRNSEGKPIRWRGTNQDITARKKQEDERRSLDERLRETQKLESLGVLAGGIAHDFNNLLTGILGNANLAREMAPAGSELHEFLRPIEQASAQAATLCQQMLAYAGKTEVVRGPLALNSLIHDMNELLRMAVSRKIELKIDPLPNLPEIEADVG